MSTFQYSQVLQDIDLSKWLKWQQYFDRYYLKCIFRDRIEIPTYTYKIHNAMINIITMQKDAPLVLDEA